jgi:hypothetical protein
MFMRILHPWMAEITGRVRDVICIPFSLARSASSLKSGAISAPANAVHRRSATRDSHPADYSATPARKQVWPSLFRKPCMGSKGSAGLFAAMPGVNTSSLGNKESNR